MAFLARARTWFAGHGVAVERVMTDNRPLRGRSVTAGACAARRTRGSAYKRFAFRDALAKAGSRHRRTRPCTPRTIDRRAVDPVPQGTARRASGRGKAERFIQTSLRAWAYASPYQTAAERAGAMPAWLGDHNRRRPHSALGGNPPISRIPKDNLLGNDS